jgi:hypothetical protein
MVANSKNRRYPRIAFPKGMRVGWQASGERFVSAVTTLGLGGLFVSTPKPAAIGEIVRLLFRISHYSHRPHFAVQPLCMGLEFSAMSQEDRARLDRLVNRLLGVLPFQPSPSN